MNFESLEDICRRGFIGAAIAGAAQTRAREQAPTAIDLELVFKLFPPEIRGHRQPKRSSTEPMTDLEVGGSHCGSVEIVQERFRRLQIDGLKPLGEPVVDRLEQLRPLTGSALIAQQPREARGGA